MKARILFQVASLNSSKLALVAYPEDVDNILRKAEPSHNWQPIMDKHVGNVTEDVAKAIAQIDTTISTFQFGSKVYNMSDILTAIDSKGYFIYP
jgi:hypothetical protein